jgi:hypothetical protein
MNAGAAFDSIALVVFIVVVCTDLVFFHEHSLLVILWRKFTTRSSDYHCNVMAYMDSQNWKATIDLKERMSRPALRRAQNLLIPNIEND